MRILQISHNHHVVGGSDSVFFETSALLSAAGHEVFPFCIGSPDNLPSPWSDFFPRGADTGAKPARGALRYFFNTEARTKLELMLDAIGQIDVAHLHIYHGKHTPAILPVLRAHNIPTVQSLHEYKLACPVYTLERNGHPCELCVEGTSLNGLLHRCKDKSFLRSLVMVAEKTTARMLGDVRLIDRFICVSNFQRQIMKRAGIPAGKLATLHNFVDTDKIRPVPGHDGYLLYAGRIEELKGLKTLIGGVLNTPQRLIIAGKGAWANALTKQICGAENISYVGFKSGRDLHRLVAGAKAVIIPSQWYENCPMSLLEAKAAGRPVIGARIGGIPELVHHGRDGFLFEPGSIGSLQEAFTALDRADHGELSKNARRDAKLRFSKPTHLDALVGHYKDISPVRAPSAWHVAQA